MGLEAIAFDKKKIARDFAGKEGGKMLTFTHVTPEDIKPTTN
jgi:nitrous oxide reductase accessory protein NosL